VHPTRCGAFKDDPRGVDGHLESLMALAKEGKARGTIVAIGELGLDYDRLEFCDAETQREMFEKQLALSEETGLPLFLHMRNAADDFMHVIERNRGKFTRGVVHSFTGTADEAKRVLQCDGLYIGINGCSLKTQENLDVVRTIPLDRMMLETDAPWCGVKNSHAGISMTSAPDHWPPTVKKEKFVPGAMVKDRCEPAHVLFIAQIVAALKGVSVEEVAETTRRAALDVFGLDD
jgi:TatD DNase family protein